ncbi:MAG TPA: DUF2695 domain-containing protein [Terriglobales bacterium]|jgi:hypothetical protein|nr:DUF2695 domain-containing protein [Terriglobales bacterium]
MASDHSHRDGSEAPDEDFVAAVATDIMKCLVGARFFEKLDDRLCPAEKSTAREHCSGNYTISDGILRSQGFDDTDINEIFAVLRTKGACCDCEILYNVVESSRLKAEYWRARATGEVTRTSHNPTG